MYILTYKQTFMNGKQHKTIQLMVYFSAQNMNIVPPAHNVRTYITYTTYTSVDSVSPLIVAR